MKTNLTRQKLDLDRLIKLSEEMHNDLRVTVFKEKAKKVGREPGQLFLSSYQRWYSEARDVIRQILPSRLNEFEALYKGTEKRKSINAKTYTIRDSLFGIHSGRDSLYERKRYYDDDAIMFMQFQMQREVLNSSRLRFLYTIAGTSTIVSPGSNSTVGGRGNSQYSSNPLNSL
jgi:hypothetical protein